jgi:tyrosyl-tRNA synthetase
MEKNFVAEVKWRGMLHDIMPGTEEQLAKEMTTGYIGFDPTADSLGIGNMVQVMMLMHFQRAGHKPIALVGGATGMIGDPSGKSEERNLLSEDLLRHNLECQQKQLSKFLDFHCGKNAAEIVNNYDWFQDMSFLAFLRDVGKHLTVSYMMSKDSVQNRLEKGISFTEFSYQLVQGFDFYYLHKHKGVKLQMGGSDQWGNIVTGTELIRRKEGGEAFALTCPLITKADGGKFGKSEKGNIWLDAKKTSPYQFYQFWLNAADADVSRYIRIFTLFEKEKIEALEAEHAKAPHQRLLQKELAKDITIRIHSASEYENALETSELLFGKGTAEGLKKLSNDDLLAVFDGVPQFEIAKSELEAGINILALLAEKTQIFPSKGEARKMVQGGGVSVNKEKIGDINFTIDASSLINHTFILTQKGKKDYFLIKAK